MNPQELIAEIFDHVRGMWRYRWLAAGIAWVICVAGWLYVYAMPNVYEASAKVFVDTNSLLKPLMKGLTVEENTLNQVDLVSRAVLTRPNLRKVAHETDLDMRAKTPAQMEALITSLQKKIKLSGGGRDQIFTITYDDVNRSKAQAVVAAVLDTFVNSALGEQGNDTDVTRKALESEIKDHERRLRDAEDRLAAFKKKNIGFMPDQAGDYYDKLQKAMADVTQSKDKVEQLKERRDELQKQLQGEVPVFGIMPSSGQVSSVAGCSESAQIAKLQDQLGSLRLQYTDKYPPIRALQDTIGRLQARCKREQQTAAAAAAATGAPATPAPTENLEENPVYQNLKIGFTETNVDLAQARTELKIHENEVAELRRDVDKITDVQTQLKRMNRDYNVIQKRHQELLQRWEDLKAKERLQPMTNQVQFRRIEPPFASDQPAGPHRGILLTLVLLCGVGAGGAVAFGLNQLRPAFFTRHSLTRHTELPVLGSVSMILTPQSAAHRRIEAIAWGAAYLLLLTSALLAAFFASRGAVLLQHLTGGAGA